MWLKLIVSLLLVQYLDAACDVCQVGRAACHSENTYSICIDGKATNDQIPCPTGYICTGEKYICYPEVDHAAICKPGPVDPEQFCFNLGQSGSYKNPDDPTCKTFIYCIQSGTGPMTGYIYDCSTKSKPYFDGKSCQAVKPDECT